MKKLTVILFLLIMCLPLFAQDKEFEGKASFKVTSYEEGGADFDYYIKDGSFRMDLKGEEGNVSIVQTDESMLLLMHDNKMYMEFPKAMMDMMEAQKQYKAESNENENIKPTKTGNTKEILGYDCEEWEMTDEDNNKVIMWVTDEVGNFMFMDSPMEQGDKPAWHDEISENGYFPMHITVIDEDGTKEAVWEVTELEEMELSSDVFSTPEGYEQMDMQKMMEKGMR